MAKTYTTVLGDTWDKIAFEQWGSEYLVPLLLEANQKYRNIVIFSAGTVLVIPDIEVEDFDDTPEWLQETSDNIEIEKESNIITEDIDS